MTASDIQTRLQNGSAPLQDISFMMEAVLLRWTNLSYFPNAPQSVQDVALEQAGWAIRYIPHPTEKQQQMAISKNYDALRFISDPSPATQLFAVKEHYEALRFIKAPVQAAVLNAVEENAAAIQWVSHLTPALIRACLAANIEVLKYLSTEVTQEELESILQHVLESPDVSERYVRRFVRFSLVPREGGVRLPDPLPFLFHHGSFSARRIAMDECLIRPSQEVPI